MLKALFYLCYLLKVEQEQSMLITLKVCFLNASETRKNKVNLLKLVNLLNLNKFTNFNKFTEFK